jgi:hypothetical protein
MGGTAARFGGEQPAQQARFFQFFWRFFSLRPPDRALK